MFSENNLGKDYSSISEHELELHVCNNERDIDESLRNMVKVFIHLNYIYMTFNPLVNISRIEKFQDLCNEDIVGRHFPIINVIKQFYFLSHMQHAIADTLETYSNFRKYSLPIFIFLGLLGNCLSAIVLFRKKMRFFSSNIYLGVLAISDIAFSIILLIDWLILMDIKPKEKYLYWLKFFMDFWSFFSEFLSVWLVVAFTIERYIVTKYPLLRRSWCTFKRAKIVVITLMGLAILRSILQIFFIFGTMHNRDAMYFKQDINIYDVYKHVNLDIQKGAGQTRKIMDSIIIFTLPALVIVICNTLIGHHIYQQNRIRKMLITASNSSNKKTQISNDKMLQHKITRMLILVSSIFIILKLPTHYFFYISRYIIYGNMVVMATLFDLLDTAHYSINFVLYCATGQTFRKELIHMFTKRKNVRKNKNEENV
ncbi:putative G-protein coupled receptor F59B2.13 isoform X2 [Linepithema humile]|uniref:putative G-protein coupled receptor F59B2.13 isoform X2 n=1 Tax=Linepithema humile TaxID=83485 RepID=UPI000623B19B|nr:PREDICTED: C-C chemokine receptor type 3-like [Linepithema humile]